MSIFSSSAQMQASKMKALAGLGLLLVAAAAAAVYFDVSGNVMGTCMLDEARTRSPLSPLSTASGSEDPLELLDALQQQCTSLNKELEALGKLVPQQGLVSLPTAATLLNNVRDFDAQYVDTLLVVDRKLANYQPRETSDAPLTFAERQAEREAEKGNTKRSSMRISLLQLVTASRRLSAALPLEEGNVNGALGCNRGILNGIEARALHEVAAESDSEESASTLSRLGAHWSELAVSGTAASPLFGSGPALPSGKASSAWVRDSWGSLAPADLVHAEDLLSRSSQVLGFQGRAMSVVYARRLAEHAKSLEAQSAHDAAAHRYRAVAKLADVSGNAPLSAHALSQLSHSLKLHGSHEEAIVVATDAVALTMDPLAQFVLATARLSSGQLTSADSLKTAEGQLRAAAGRLPTEELEWQRKKMQSEMMMWRWISNGDMSKCRVVPDVARFLICTVCKLIF